MICRYCQKLSHMARHYLKKKTEAAGNADVGEAQGGRKAPSPDFHPSPIVLGSECEEFGFATSRYGGRGLEKAQGLR